MRFSDLLHHTLKREGGYSNDPLDPGGATNFGITQKVYDAWREDHHLVPRTVRQITPDEVVSIYEERYWEAVRGDELMREDANCALQVFDMAVNAGVGRAIKLFQRALHQTEDGELGFNTMSAYRAADKATLRDAYAAERARFYRSLVAQKPALGKFLAGWLKRVEIIRKAV